MNFSRATGMPFISGKDSLQPYRGKDGKVIKIPPVLCISVFGGSPTLPGLFRRTSRNRTARLSWWVTATPVRVAGSVYDLLGIVGSNLPKIDPT